MDIKKQNLVEATEGENCTTSDVLQVVDSLKADKEDSPVLDGAKIERAMVKNIIITNSVILESKIFSCQVFNSLIRASQLKECIVQGGDLADCDLIDTAYLFKRKHTSLDRLPPEIRNILFKYVLVWDGKTPALLKALRGDPKLYGEAMEVFNNINTFILHTKSKEDLVGMLPKVIASVKRIHYRVDGPFPQYLRAFTWPNVTHFTFEVGSFREVWPPGFLYRGTPPRCVSLLAAGSWVPVDSNCLIPTNQCPSLETLTVISPPPPWQATSTQDMYAKFGPLIQKFGLVKRYQSTDEKGKATCVWKKGVLEESADIQAESS